MKKFIQFSVLSILLIMPFAVLAQTTEERITSYNSNIEVQKDSSLLVTETIKVVSTGDQIQRGIYRDFPIAYTDNTGRRYFVSFDLIEVTRNGEQEPFHTEKAGNGVRVYIGSENVYIPNGEHTYTLKFKTERQLGFFADHDELYWNVTGNGWEFPIDSASATVRLPNGVLKQNIKADFFTGVFGSTQKEGSYVVKNAEANFSTNRKLNAYEGLTIVVSWPKGFVTPPSTAENFWALVKANLDFVIGVFGLGLILFYYFYIWNKKGRDPKKGTVIAQYEAPQGFSPAFLRYLSRMGKDNKGFAAAVINLAVKGRLTVKETSGFLKKTTYTLTAKKNSTKNLPLSEDEQVLEIELFSGRDEFILDNKNATEILKVIESLSTSLKQKAGNKYFVKNTSASVIGIAFSILVFIGAIAAASIYRFGDVSVLQLVFWPVFVISLLVINIVFERLVRAYTIEGRKLMDEIEGFKLFLSVTEKDRLAFHNPPEKTPELFEKMLPYALALGVEHKWAQQFTKVFENLKAAGTSYVPIWYYGAGITNFSAENFSSTVGKTFTGVVSSASVPPGSSSGFGGSSGGGGGGGGGGGW